MKKRIVALSLCLLLAGCGEVPKPAPIPVELPTPAEPTCTLPQEIEAGLISPYDYSPKPVNVRDYYVGASFSALSKQVGRNALYSNWNCLVWQSMRAGADTLKDSNVSTPDYVHAAVTKDGETVTWLITWTRKAKAVPWEDGRSWSVDVNGPWPDAWPIDPVENLSALWELSMEELQEQLGPYHFDAGSGLFIPCWFTRDGKLISASFGGVDVYDLLHPDQVWVHNASCIENLSRWSRFVENAGWGRPDELTLRLDLSSALMGGIGVDTTDVQLPAYGDLFVTYNGEVYGVTPMIRVYASSTPPEAEISRHYSYLITDAETDSRFQTRDPETEGVSPVISKIHYLLSNDPDMTYERYMLQGVRDTAPTPGSETMLLFSQDYDGLKIRKKP